MHLTHHEHHVSLPKKKILGLYGMLAASRMARLLLVLQDGDLILPIERMARLRGLDTVRISEVKGHADEALVRGGVLVILIGQVIMELMRLLILFVGGCLAGLLRLGVIILGFVLVGARLFSACIGFLLPVPGLLSIMMVWLVLLCSCPLCNDRCWEGFRQCKNARGRSCSFSTVVDIPVVVQRQSWVNVAMMRSRGV